MPSITLFLEDAFHENFLTALVQRLARESGIYVNSRAYSSTGGLPKLHHEFGEFLQDLSRDVEILPDAILVATDANCHGYRDRRQLIEGVVARTPQFEYLMIYAIPDPHIERWMFSDPAAFQTVFGRGCAIGAQKCERNIYKKLLLEEIIAAGIMPPLGGQEYAAEFVDAMNLARAGANEPSLGLLVRDLRAFFNRWTQGR